MIIRTWGLSVNETQNHKVRLKSLLLAYFLAIVFIQSNKRETGQVVMHTQPGRKDENRPQATVKAGK